MSHDRRGHLARHPRRSVPAHDLADELSTSSARRPCSRCSLAANDFAPATKIDGVPAQEYLQGHYIDAVKQVVVRLKGLPNVVGYDSLNEPGSGFLGVPI